VPSRRSLPLGLITLVIGLLLAGCSESLPFVPTPAPTPVQPREVVIETVLAPAGAPLPGVSVSADGQSAVTDTQGQATLSLLPGAIVEAELAGHDPAEGSVPEEGPVTLELRDNVARGTVTGPEGDPVAGVRVFVDGGDTMVETDDGGEYALPGVLPGATLIFKMPGYRLHELEAAASMEIDVTLDPFEARALYAPSAVFEGPGRLEALLDLIERTEANAMVIDVKETDGRLYYSTDLETAAEVGAIRETVVFELEELLPMLKERGIYTIAPHGGDEGQHLGGGEAGACSPQQRHRRAVARQHRRRLARPIGSGRGGVHREHRRRPRRQGVRRGAARLHPLLQRRAL